MKKIILVCLFFIFLGYIYCEKPIGLIAFAEGEGFYITRNGEQINFELSKISPLGEKIYKNDFISTLSNTFIEIQFEPSKNKIKLSEDTSITISEISETGGAKLDLVYGRIRAKVDILAQDESFIIKGPSVISEAKGTDFGFDVEYNFDNLELIGNEESKVYCFEGNVETTNIKIKQEPILLLANEMILISGDTQELNQKTVISSDILSFWEKHDFSGNIVEMTPDPSEQSQITEVISLVDEKAQEFKTFGFDLGFDASYWYCQKRPEEDLLAVFYILSMIKAGFFADFRYNFDEVKSAGLEIGFQYTQYEITFGTETIQVTLFSVPLYLIYRISPGNLFFQPYAGLTTEGAVIDGSLSSDFAYFYEAGIKLGFNNEKSSLYVITGIVLPQDKLELNDNDYAIKLGLGGLFRFDSLFDLFSKADKIK